jgi:hypothetical protein
LDGDPVNFAVLLVDSEDPVPEGLDAAAHLRKRDGRTGPLLDGQVHLMVQCMEAWFLADILGLAAYYGNGFSEPALRANPRIEQIPKKDLLDRLKRATQATSKGSYHKTRHGFAILERLEPSLVKQKSPFAARLFGVLLEVSLPL